MPENLQHPREPRWATRLREQLRERHLTLLGRSLALFAVTVVVFAVAFHAVMAMEGQSHRWWVGFYWAVSTMTTLGLGDLIFESALGAALTSIAVLSGVLFMLVLLPLLLIQFPPWIEAQVAAGLRRRLDRDLRGHVLITKYEPVTAELVRTLRAYHYPYSVIVADVNEAVRLKELGLVVMRGAPDNPETWRRARLEHAALVIATDTDIRNTNAVFTARGVSEGVSLLATAKRPEVADVLELAGCDHVLQLTDMMGRVLARRVIGSDALTHEVGSFDELVIAEASAARTPLVGKTLVELRLADMVDVALVGVWERGEFEISGPDTLIGPHTTLVLAGTPEQMLDYDQLFAIYNVSGEPMVVLGGGTVGRTTADSLRGRGIPYRIVDRHPHVLRDENGIQGDAADIEVLERAGIAKAPAVIITTHDDDTNIFLALYCRKLRADMQIVSRANFEKNVETLHRAGTDSVISLTSMGANAIFNVLERGEVVTFSEGLNFFKLPVPASLAGKSLAESRLREDVGVSVVALMVEGNPMRVAPDPLQPLPDEADLVLIGTREGERQFQERFGE